MNGERFFAVYERVSDAPDAVGRLRRFVLDLAVRGKLVEQDSADEPASELLKRITAEKVRMVRAGEIKAKRPPPDSTPGEVSMSLPSGWSSVRLAEITACLDYKRKPINASERAKRIEGKGPDELFPYYGATQQQGWIDDYLFDEELVLLGEDGVPFLDPYRPKAYLIRGKTWVNNHAHVFRGILVSHPYLVHVLNVFDYSGRVAGATRAKLNQTRALGIPLPLPPLAEQRRIVAKVDELMALCDRLEDTRAAREDTRDRLTQASYARLTVAETDERRFRSHARFAVDSLRALTARADQVKHLRQTILSLAVRGKLVEQNPTNEPASELLKRIAAERTRLVKAREIRKPNRMPALDTNQLAFDPPQGWTWTRLVEISRKVHYGFTASANRAVEAVRLLRITDIQDNSVDWPSVPGCEIAEKVLPKFRLEKGDILIARTGGTIGKSFLVQDVPVTAVFASYLIRIQASREVYDRYLKVFLDSPAYWTQLRDGARGAGQPNVNGQTLGRMAVPVPPLAEQHRIVSRIDDLMALCDKLEAGLSAADGTRGRLLESLLSHAL